MTNQNRQFLTTLANLGIATHRLDRIRDAARLHRQQLLGTSELYAVIEADDEPEAAACAHCGSSDHTWDDCEAYTRLVAEDAAAPAAVSAAVAPPTQAALRDRIAQAIDTAYQNYSAEGHALPASDMADAVLAELPSAGCLTPEYTDGPCHCPACDPAAHRTDRSAVLADVERAIRTATGSCGYKAEDGCDFCNGVDAALDQVRRMADVGVTPPPALTEKGRLRAQVQVLQQDAERDQGLAKVGARCMREGHQGLIESGRATVEGHRFALSVALDLGTGAPWDAIHERVKGLRRMADETATETPTPHRGDAFEQWLKARRDEWAPEGCQPWQILDQTLEEYRLHADTGTPLGEHVCEGKAVGDCECLEQPAAGARQDGTPDVQTQPATPMTAHLTTPCDACNHTLNWHSSGETGCTVLRCACARYYHAAGQGQDGNQP